VNVYFVKAGVMESQIKARRDGGRVAGFGISTVIVTVTPWAGGGSEVSKDPGSASIDDGPKF